MVSLATLSTLGPALYSLVIIALGINGGAHDDKWVRVNTPPTLAEGAGDECWVDRGNLHSHRTCCGSPTGASPCNPLGEWLGDVLESNVGAWLLPLVPWLLHLNVRIADSSRHDVRRLGLHVCILLFRCLVLWLLFDSIEDKIVGPEQATHPVLRAAANGAVGEIAVVQITDEPPGPAVDQSTSCTTWAERGECEANIEYMEQTCATSCSPCWYGYMREDFKCAELFDFSDHLVLYMVSYSATAGLEAYAYLATGRDMWPVFVPLTTSLVIVITICMYRTAAFFHTPGEAITGWAISLLFVHLPLFLALFGGRASKLHHWIVEPPPPNSKREAHAHAVTAGAKDPIPEAEAGV